jgi:lysophospholipase L1-like esterase
MAMNERSPRLQAVAELVVAAVLACRGNIFAAEPAANQSEASPAPIRIVLAGDSTVAEGNGWGPGFAKCLDDQAVCINVARNGRSSRSFRDEGLWAKCLAAKPDYVLIQFGHNDQPGKGPERETDPDTTYREFMTDYVREARAAGAVPVLVTSLSRRQWGHDGRIHSTLVPYVDVVKEIAAAENVPLIDLHARSIALYEQLGREGCNELSPMDKKKPGQIDNTHLNAKGSEVIGQIVAEELGRVEPKLAPHIKQPAAAQ